MRGLVGGLTSPHPIGSTLPAVFQEEDPFAIRLTEAFDEALAPILATLDNLPAYFDPRLAPEDFLGWLASWVAFDLDERWDAARRREAVARAVDLLRRRGTAGGLADEIRLVTGGEVEVIENGGTAWSLDPGGDFSGSGKPTLVVRIRVDDPAGVDADRVDRVVLTAKPAHVPHRVEIEGGPKATRKKEAAPTRKPATPAKATSPDEPPARAPSAADGATATDPAAADEAPDEPAPDEAAGAAEPPDEPAPDAG